MTDTSKREELIEEAAKAIQEVRWVAARNSDGSVSVHEADSETLARAAFAVFEQAHTPTEDERELSRRWQEVVNAPGFVAAVEAEARGYHDSACRYQTALSRAEETIEKVRAEADAYGRQPDVMEPCGAVAQSLHFIITEYGKQKGADRG